MAQILEEYGAAELELGHQLQATEADRLATGQQTIETVELPDSPLEDADLRPETEPSEPPQTNEPTEAKGTEAAVTEPPSVTTPPTDPTPPEPRILDIFDDA